MLATQRQDHILAEVRAHGAARVTDLVEALDVSDMTIRRDITELARAGLVRRVHGGAVAPVDPGRATDEPGFETKRGWAADEKLAIAREALRTIQPGQSVALSAGTTTHLLAQLIAADASLRPLTVVTNSLPVADALHRAPASGSALGSGTTPRSGAARGSDPQGSDAALATAPGTPSGPTPGTGTGTTPATLTGPTPGAGTGGALEVILTGGVRTPSDALVGPVADAALERLRVDQVFLGVHGLDPAGATTPNLLEAATDRALLACAGTVTVLADHTKWNVVGLARIARLDDIDVLISDDALPRDARTVLDGAVGRLLLARTDPTHPSGSTNKDPR